MRGILFILMISFSTCLSAHNMPVSFVKIVFDADGGLDLELHFDVDSCIGSLITDDEDLLSLAIQYSRARFLNTAEAETKRIAELICAQVSLQFDDQCIHPTLTKLDLGLATDTARTHIAYFHAQAPRGHTRCQWNAHPLLQIVSLEIMSDGIIGSHVEVIQNYGSSGVYAGVPSNSLDILIAYLYMGVQHIIPKGIDHLLFIVGLFFAISKRSQLLWQVTAFTFAHSITLGLGASGYQFPEWLESMIEPIIALTIIYVAIENCFFDKMTRWRPLLVFIFGLIHGMGFASVLSNIGLPDAYFWLALLSFNLGIECAQLGVLLLASILLWYARDKIWYRSYIVIPSCTGIALTGLWMFIERM